MSDAKGTIGIVSVLTQNINLNANNKLRRLVLNLIIIANRYIYIYTNTVYSPLLDLVQFNPGGGG